MIALFYALESEIKELKRRHGSERLSAYRDCRVDRSRFGAKEVLLIGHGVGKRRTLEALDYVLPNYPVTLVISAGFAGALNDKSKAGDVFAAGHMGAEQPVIAAEKYAPLVADSSLLDAAKKIQHKNGYQSLIGMGLTVAEICATPQAKRTLCTAYGADFVDMESYWIGLAAAAKGIPFITVRAVSDSVRDDLTFIGELTSEGRVLPEKVARHFFSHPGDLPKSIGLSGNISRARRNLDSFLEQLIGEIGQ